MPLRYGSRFLVLLALIMVVAACGGGTGVTPAPVATTQPATTAPVSTAASSIFAALPQSKTPEGYYVLGRADAPIVIEFYSDFL
jgi:hypothetical protein